MTQGMGNEYMASQENQGGLSINPEDNSFTTEQTDIYNSPEQLARMNQNRQYNTATNNYDTNGNAINTNPSQTQVDRINLFNPYGGTDIPSAAYLLGQGIGSGNTGQSLLAGSKLGLKHSDEARAKMSRKRMSEEARRKISEARKGKILSVEHRAKMSESHKNISDETRRKMSEAQKGRTHSAETRAKISAKKKNISDETREKIRASKIGTTHSKETLAKLSASHKGQIPWNKGKKKGEYKWSQSPNPSDRIGSACMTREAKRQGFPAARYFVTS